MGTNVHVNRGCMIDASHGEIYIGSDVLIGLCCVLRASNHVFANKNISISQQGHSAGKIVIEDDVWLGAHVIVLPDVTIGKGSVIGAGAVVKKEVEPFSIAVGIPVRKIKSRGDQT